jgi:uncharacterized membrane protein YphA (DoxX/SURF4 family)
LPGLGLLLLRLALAAALAASGAAAIAAASDTSGASGVLGLLAVASGGALLFGAFTPAAGILAALVTLASAAASTASVDATVGWRVVRGDGLVLVVSVALVLLGPGAFSLDARLFGWREIVVPRAGRPASGFRASHSEDPPAS